MNPITKFCRRHNISQAELVRLTDVSKSSISRMRGGKQDVPLKLKITLKLIEAVGIKSARSIVDNLLRK